MFHKLTYLIIYPPIKLLFRVKVVGKENIPKNGPFIIAGNHVSYLDPILAGCSVFPKSPNYFAKKQLFDIPFFGLLIKALGAFPAERERMDRNAIRIAIDVLKRKGILIIFPQGTRTKEMDSVYNGAAYFAYKTKVPVLPVAIIGTDKIMPPGKRFPRFPKVTVRIGKPLTAEGLDKHNYQDLTKEIMGQIIKMMEKGRN